MTTAQVSRIAPPPSVAAVLSALTEESRIGQVDFTSRLAPEPEPTDEVAEDTKGRAAHPLVTAAPSVESLTAVEDLDDDEDLSDEDLSDHDEDDHEDEEEPAAVVSLQAVPELEPEPEPAAPAVAGKARTVTKKHTGRAAKATPTPEPQTELEETVAAPRMERVHEPVQVSFAVDDRVDEGEVTLVLPELEERPPSVEEIARLVVERMHDAELAMMRHLEAIEAEAARRAELLTAQAELDAELIRLNARREAHHIITQARQRAQKNATVSPEQRQVDELTDSLTRFADVVDELRPAAPRTTRGLTP